METEKQNLFLEDQYLTGEIDSLNAGVDELNQLCRGVSPAANEQHATKADGSKTRESFFLDWTIA